MIGDVDREARADWRAARADMDRPDPADYEDYENYDSDEEGDR